MAFFARPNLDDIQFKQLKGSELTLSGQTRIATTSGLTLTDGSGGNIIVTASGASNNFDVLTYCNGIISLKPSSGGGTGVYDGLSPSTCSVGGLPEGTDIYGSGYTALFQCILVPTKNPILTAPKITSFTISPATTLYEIGTSVSIVSTTVFNAGSIDPPYPPLLPTDDCRSCGASGYSYNNWGYPTPVFVPNTTPSNSYTYGSHTINGGSNTLSVYVNYCGGPQPKNSAGNDYLLPLAAGITTSCTRNIIGTYPWFWGTSVGAPTIGQALIDSYTTGDGKRVQSNFNTIIVDNFNASDKYLWFAIPAGNTKTAWQGANNVSNNGVIPGGLFPAPTTISIDSPESLWTSQSYEIYVSNYATSINYGMTFS